MNVYPTQATQFQEAIRRILVIVKVHRIYRSFTQQNGLVIVLRGRNQLTHVLEPILDSQLEPLGYRAYLIRSRDIRDGMRKGSIMLSNTLHIDRLLYADPESEDDIFEQAGEPAAVVRRTRMFLQEEQAKIDGFKEGVQRYEASGNYIMATFMLHQRLELTLRAVAYLMVGWQLRSHSITQAIDFLSNHIPGFRQSIGADTDELLALLPSLDRAYKAARYSNDYIQTEATCQRLVQWAGLVEQVVSQSVEAAIADYLKTTDTDTLQSASEGNVTPTSQSPLDQIVHTLGKKLPLYSLYLLVEQQHSVRRHNLLGSDDSQTNQSRYLMLAIAHPQEGLATTTHQAKDELNNSGLPIELALLCHTIDEAARALASHNPFFHRVFKYGRQLISPTEEMQLGNPMADHAAATQKITIAWEAYYRRAVSLTQIAAQYGLEGFTDTQIQLLYMAYEQLLSGLVYRSLSYLPKRSSLLSLLHLLTYTAPTVVDELNIMGPELKRLSALFKHIRFGPLTQYDEGQVARWQRKMEHILEQSHSWAYHSQH